MQGPYQPVGGTSFPAGPGYDLRPPPGPLRRDVSAVDAIRFVFQEQNTMANLFFGLLLQIIPIVGPITLLGWICEVHRRLVWQHPNPLPKFSFDDFGMYLRRGVVPFVGQLVLVLVVMLPMMLVIGVAVGVAVATSASPEVVGIIAGASGLVMLPFILVVGVFIHSVTTLGELTEDFGVMLSPGQNWDYARAVWPKVLIAGSILSALAFGVFIGGLLLCIVGVYVAIQVIHFANVHLRWQIYNDHLLRGGRPIAVKPLEPLASERRGAAFPPPPLGYPPPPVGPSY